MQNYDLEKIKEMPTTFEGVHDSAMRSYHILNKVLAMVERGDSIETILEVAEYLKLDPVNHKGIEDKQ